MRHFCRRCVRTHPSVACTRDTPTGFLEEFLIWYQQAGQVVYDDDGLRALNEAAIAIYGRDHYVALIEEAGRSKATPPVQLKVRAAGSGRS